MFKEFICGVLTVSELGEPDWGEVAARLGLTQQLMEEDATFKFMSAIKNDEGAWQVPFLAYGSMGPELVKEPISRFCPYELARVSAVRPGRMPLDRLEDLRELVKGAMGPVSASDLAGRAAACPRPEGGEEVFSGLVGMEEQRLMLMKLGTAVAKHGRGVVDCLHFVFEGNPGTGKTELASRLVSYLDRVGVTDGTHRMVQVGGNDLMAPYAGQTTPKVKKVVESARGGMLFIDEFYSLMTSGLSYGREAIDTLTEQLDRCRDDLVCVIAGYPAEVRETLDLNPGLRDRFGYRVEFPDYSTDQLVQIFCRMAGDRGFTVACVDALPGAMEALRRSAGFSNARTARKLVDHAVVEASWARDEAVITADDLECALPQCLGAPARRPAGC